MQAIHTLNIVEQYEKFFNGITEAEFKEMSKEEIMEMLDSIKISIDKQAE